VNKGYNWLVKIIRGVVYRLIALTLGVWRFSPGGRFCRNLITELKARESGEFHP
jgi:hypothetical protein